MEKRVKEIDRLLFHIGNFEANKPVHAKYAAIRWKKPKEKFAADHKEELDAYNAALRYFKVHLDGAKYSTKKQFGDGRLLCLFQCFQQRRLFLFQAGQPAL